MKLFLYMSIVFLLSAAVFAQEVQVPLDNNGSVEVVDSKMNDRLQIFKEYDYFSEARLFKLNDSNFVLEISYFQDKKLNRQRKFLNLDAVKLLRDNISTKLAETATMPEVNQEGRTQLIVTSTVLTLTFYAWALPFSLSVNDAKVAVATYMVTGAAGFLIPYYLTKYATVTKGTASFYGSGGILGLGHGAFFAGMFGAEDAKPIIASMMIGSIAESIVNYYIARSSDMQEGTAAVITSFALSGMACGLGSGLFFDDPNFQTISTLCLAWSVPAYILGSMTANSQKYTIGDATVLTNTNVLGMYLPVAGLVVAGVENKAPYGIALLAGTAAGLWLGNELVKGKDFTESQGTYITLGTLTGALLGSGLGYLIDDNSGKAIVGLGALGATVGFLTMYFTYSDIAETGSATGSLEFNVSPFGLAGMMDNRPAFLKDRHIPAFSLQYKF